jgi:Cytochrome c oxidase subunit Vb
LSIPTDREQQAGRRLEEILDQDAGGVGFNLEPIIPDAAQGTESNPILVPSREPRRAVGYEDPVSHQLVWFNLYPDKLTYVRDIGLYFKIQRV